ncbi:MAG: cysteine desulfurase [Phyllobacteriaceae bacterium]|nr:cysteine desulfurase [Phyllobacteriaceae bacterium]
MNAPRSWLDWNATAPLGEAARAAMIAALDAGNPSSVHADGRAARALVEKARRQIAALCGTRAEHVVFTSGASEAAATVLTPDWRLGRSPLRFSRLYVAATDHPCVLSGGRFPAERVMRLGVDASGVIDLATLEAALAGRDNADGLPLVAVHLANNETGVIQPIAEIAALVHAAGGRLIVDAVQAPGRISVDLSTLNADFLILSAHKIGGPKGTGAIIGASDLLMPAPLIGGGGQERGHRAGTENVAAISGFGAAADEAARGLAHSGVMAIWREGAEAEILRLAPDAVFHGRLAPRLPNTTYFSIPGLKAETMQIAFDLEGVSVSAGSACSSGKVGRSPVLDAMGADADLGAIRVSIGPATGDREMAALVAALEKIVARREKPARAA